MFCRDGALKRSAPKKELKEYFQHEYSRTLKLVDDLEGEEGNQNVIRRKVSRIEDPDKIANVDVYSPKSKDIRRKVSKTEKPREDPRKVAPEADVEKRDSLSPKSDDTNSENLALHINSLDNNFSNINGIKSKVNGNIIETESKLIGNDIGILNGNENDTTINKISNNFDTELKNRQNILDTQKEIVSNHIVTGLKSINNHFMNGEKESEIQNAE